MKTIFKHLYLLCALSCLGLVISCKNRAVSFSLLESEESELESEESELESEESELESEESELKVEEQEENKEESRQPASQAIYQIEVFSAPKIDPTLSIQSVTESKKTALDIVFVIDNSGGMRKSQNKLKIHVQNLYKNIQKSKIDVQIGIVTTDAYLSSKSDFYAAPGNDRILTQNTPDMERQFMENVMVGTDGDPIERGISSLITVLKNKPDFLRTNAHLSVFVLSDEDEMKTDGNDKLPKDIYVPLYLDELKKLKGSDAFSVTAIVDTYLWYQGNPSPSSGVLYMDMAHQTRGKVYDIQSEFSHIIKGYGEFITKKIEIKKEPYYFKFAEAKDLSHALEVFVDGEKKTEGTDYFYSETENGIYFADSSLPEEGSEIEVRY